MKLSNILWGIILVGLGIIFGLNALEITSINVFFDGWWTLFIIVPSFVDLFNEKEGKTGSLVGLLIGIFLLLACQDILSFTLVWKLAFPALLVVVGLSILFKDVLKNKVKKKIKILNKQNGGVKEYCAIFGSQDIKFTGNAFNGCNLTAIFGGIKYDLTEEKFNGEVVIEATALFGGIDIIVPEDVNVEVTAFPLFGGVSDNRKHKSTKDSKKTIYVNATCMFGGVEIK